MNQEQIQACIAACAASARECREFCEAHRADADIAHLRDQLPRLCRAVRDLHPRTGTRCPGRGRPLPRLRGRVRALRRGIPQVRG